jgi:hypothetical protein
MKQNDTRYRANDDEDDDDGSLREIELLQRAVRLECRCKRFHASVVDAVALQIELHHLQ